MYNFTLSTIVIILLLDSIWTITIIGIFSRKSRKSKTIDDHEYRKTKIRSVWGFAIAGLCFGLGSVMVGISVPNNPLNFILSLFIVVFCTVLISIGGLFTFIVSVQILKVWIGQEN